MEANAPDCPFNGDLIGIDVDTQGKELVDETELTFPFHPEMESGLALLRWRSGGAAARG
jgi:hypothetical protein